MDCISQVCGGKKLQIGDTAINTAWRDSFALARFCAMTWKRKYWFGEPGPTVSLDAGDDEEDEPIEEFRRRTILSRLDGPNPRRRKLRDLPEDLRKDKLILVYGDEYVVIPMGYCPVPELNRIRRFRASRLWVEQALISITLLLSFQLSPAIITVTCSWMAVNLLAWFFGGRIAKPNINPDDNLFVRVSKSANHIELAARQFGTGPDQPKDRRLGRDVILYYRGQATWCRCQTKPSGKNTWIEVNLPSKLPFFDFLFRINELTINTFIPWGWMGDYSANRSLGGIALGLTAIHQSLGWLALAFAMIIKIVRPNSDWADGDTWVFTWYVCLIQWLTGNVLSFKNIWQVFTLALLKAYRAFNTPV